MAEEVERSTVSPPQTTGQARFARQFFCPPNAEPGPRLRSGGFGGSSLLSKLSVPITPKFPSHSLSNACHTGYPGNGVALVRRKHLPYNPFTIGQFRITKIHPWLPVFGISFFFSPSASEPVSILILLNQPIDSNGNSSLIHQLRPQGAFPWLWRWEGKSTLGTRL